MDRNEKIQGQREKVLFPNYSPYPIAIQSGEGHRVYDANGREYLDFLSGVAVTSLGHNHPGLIRALRHQAKKVWHVSNWVDSEPQIKLARLLSQRCFAQKTLFVNSGTEANEAAIKLARRWSFESFGPGRHEIIVAEGAFHGRTYGSLSATPNPAFHEGFGPLVPGFRPVPFGDIDAMRRAIGKDTCAILIEPIQGESGVNTAPDTYFQVMRQLANEFRLLLIFDEIQTGMGRTGEWFAHQHFGIEPDIMTLAKGLGGGMPIGAVLARNKVARVMTPGTHGTTFGGNPLACSAAVEVIKAIDRQDLLKNVREVGQQLRDGLNDLGKRHSVIRQVRGMGLMLGVELDRSVEQLPRKFLDQGVLVNVVRNQVVRLLPPLNLPNEAVAPFLTAFENVVKSI